MAEGQCVSVTPCRDGCNTDKHYGIKWVLLDFGDAEQWFQWLANVLDFSNT